MEKPLIIKNNAHHDTEHLCSIVTKRLQKRLQSSKHYSQKEIEEIESKNPYLFPTGFKLSKHQAKRLRALCSLSQAELRPPRKLTSHRKFLGPIIVFLKKATWPLIKYHLNDSFKGIAQFQAWTVSSIASLEIENAELREEIAYITAIKMNME